jgi:hypothetical protein
MGGFIPGARHGDSAVPYRNRACGRILLVKSQSRTIERLALAAFLLAIAGGLFDSVSRVLLWTMVGVLAVVVLVAVVHERRKRNASR